MWDAAADATAALERVLADLAGAVAGAAPGWILLGVALHLLNQVTRGRGWFALVRTASGADPRLRRRDAIGAWMAGAGAGGLVSARGGDAVRVLLLRRRLGETGCPVLAGTLIAEGAGELLVGLVVLAAALALGVGRTSGRRRRSPSARCSPCSPRSWPAAASSWRGTPGGRRGPAASPSPPAGSRAAWRAAARRCARRGPTPARCCPGSCSAAPAGSARWRASSPPSRCRSRRRCCCSSCSPRGAAGWCRSRPPRSAPGVAVLAASFETVAGTAVPTERLAAFFIGTSTVLTVVGTLIALVLCMPRRATAAPMPYPSAAATIPATMSKT